MSIKRLRIQGAIVGSVEDVDIALIDDAYSINGLNIRQAGDTKRVASFCCG